MLVDLVLSGRWKQIIPQMFIIENEIQRLMSEEHQQFHVPTGHAKQAYRNVLNDTFFDPEKKVDGCYKSLFSLASLAHLEKGRDPAQRREYISALSTKDWFICKDGELC